MIYLKLVLAACICYLMFGAFLTVINMTVWHEVVRKSDGQWSKMKSWQIILCWIFFPGQVLREVFATMAGNKPCSLVPILPFMTPVSLGSWRMFAGIMPTLGQSERIVKALLNKEKEYPKPLLSIRSSSITMDHYWQVKLLDSILFSPLNLLMYPVYILGGIITLIAAAIIVIAILLSPMIDDW